MSETDPGPLPASKMELAVLIINGSPIYAKSPVLSRRLPDLSSTFTYHLYYPHYCYPGKSPALAIILLSLLSLFAFKSGKICTHNSIDSFFIISSSVVCSEFNHSPFHRRMDRGEQGTLQERKNWAFSGKNLTQLNLTHFICTWRILPNNYTHCSRNEYQWRLQFNLKPWSLLSLKKTVGHINCNWN